MVGLPEAAVRESRHRVRAAISCAQLEFPNRRITVNLAPADLPKDSGRFDLPLALGILAANDAIDARALDEYEFIGELALTGEVRAVDGVLPEGMNTLPTLPRAMSNVCSTIFDRTSVGCGGDYLK